MTIIDKVNLFLKQEKIALNSFKELCFVAELCVSLEHNPDKILTWFRFLQVNEIPGWRTKEITKKIAQLLINNSKLNKIQFYALFCPSYKKGDNAFGFRLDGVGVTTVAGIANLLKFYNETQNLGFLCETPLAIFFDLALEQYDKIVANDCLSDLERNIENLKQMLPGGVDFKKLSDLDESLKEKIGYAGYRWDKLLIPQQNFDRIVKRGKKFYDLFGWSEEKIRERSLIIANSESLVGDYLKQNYKTGMMIYTPTMLERGAVYSGFGFKNDPLVVIFPRK